MKKSPVSRDVVLKGKMFCCYFLTHFYEDQESLSDYKNSGNLTLSQSWTQTLSLDKENKLVA